MTLTVSFAESAMADLEAILNWYTGELVPDVGRQFVAEIFSRTQALAIHPDIGRMAPEFQQGHIQELIHPPFRIVYKREAERVRIVRVYRSERLLNDDEFL